MENKLVSILIPCYNVENYIEDTVKSLQKQTYKNIEIVCINDGSTDSTYDKLIELKNNDDRIVLHTQENIGIGRTREKLAKTATGELSVFLDADDAFKKDNSIEFMVKKHNKNKYVCTGFNFKAFYDKFTLGLWFRYTILNIMRIMIPFIHSNPLNRNWYFWAKIYDTEYLSEGLWNDLSVGEEKQFFTDNPRKIKFYRKQVYRYRVRANSAMSRK